MVAISAERLKADLGAEAIVMNGPRFFMMDRIASENMSAEVVSFDGLTMRLVAVVQIPPRQRAGSQP